MNNLSYEISEENIIHNLNVIRKIVGEKVLIAPCVKANAYGHGLIKVSQILQENGADWLCINSVDEAVRLRSSGITLPLLLIGIIFDEEIKDLISSDVTPVISDIETAKKINELCTKNNKKINVFIKIDTGMGRLGFMPEGFEKAFEEISGLKSLNIVGLITHYAKSSQRDIEYLDNQTKAFASIAKGKKLILSAAKTAPIFIDKKYHFDLVRPGIAIYGYYPSEKIKRDAIKKGYMLKTVLKIKTRVGLVKEIPANHCVGYGCTFVTKRKTKIAVIPIGYHECLDRRMANKSKFLINGEFAPVIGNICMNLTMLNVTNIPNVKKGGEVVILGRQKNNEITADHISKDIGTTPYEIIVKFGKDNK